MESASLEWDTIDYLRPKIVFKFSTGQLYPKRDQSRDHERNLKDFKKLNISKPKSNWR